MFPGGYMYSRLGSPGLEEENKGNISVKEKQANNYPLCSSIMGIFVA